VQYKCAVVLRCIILSLCRHVRSNCCFTDFSLYTVICFLVIHFVNLMQVNCISTEFTPKKHGGEKGVPFRIQVETYLQGEGTLKRLHAAACQIKVFKVNESVLYV